MKESSTSPNIIGMIFPQSHDDTISISLDIIRITSPNSTTIQYYTNLGIIWVTSLKPEMRGSFLQVLCDTRNILQCWYNTRHPGIGRCYSYWIRTCDKLCYRKIGRDYSYYTKIWCWHLYYGRISSNSYRPTIGGCHSYYYAWIGKKLSPSQDLVRSLLLL